MIVGIDPKIDYAFKRVYGREEADSILIDLANSILASAANCPVVEVQLLNPFNPKEAPDDKLSILDVKARDQSGRQFNIEMQMVAHQAFEKRILYYWAKLHQQQLREGQNYGDLQPTIAIVFLNDVLFPDVPVYRWRFRLLDEQSRCFSEDIELYLFELPKFTKTASELQTREDEWLYFLRHGETIDMENVPASLRRPPVLHALEELVVLSQTAEEREQYESRRKAQLDYTWGLKSARMEGERIGEQKGRLEGLAEGEKKGLVEGEKKGLAEGEKKGLAEGEKKGLAEGEKKGLAEGEKRGEIKRIQSYERLLKRPATAAATLAEWSLEELSRRARELEEEVFKKT